jgi:hypothetical protein
MNTVLGYIFLHFMLTAGKILCTVRYLTFMFFFDYRPSHLSPVKSDWHTALDAGKWILLPDAATLAEVHHYVGSAIAWRKDPASGHVEDFRSKVHSL